MKYQVFNTFASFWFYIKVIIKKIFYLDMFINFKYFEKVDFFFYFKSEFYYYSKLFIQNV